ncbi:MAG: aminotransferase class I/II-fold pyridoxal phosphate-dependent enzyme [Burkholderiales bacterium]|nr:aminotransferase class I/II-fold pyridoxal phosphate-dependent enzyme [Burkholderiales bacterium]
MPVLPRKLPNAGTTIFSRMSQLALEAGAINLGQGFPDFDPDPALVEAVHRAMREGHNQYPAMAGLPLLRERLATKLHLQHGRAYDPALELTISAGGTQAIYTALQCLLEAGDEALLLEPAFDSYAPAVYAAHAHPVGVPLDEVYRPDWQRVATAITPRTRVILVNSPHNPSGRVFDDADLDALHQLAERHDLAVISDEVYEHMVFDGRPHCSVARHEGLAARSFIVGSFGKTFHVTGWKVGYVAAPAPLTAAFRALHQYTVFTVNPAVQKGLADHLQDAAHWQGLAPFYQAKRDRFRAGLAGTRLRLLSCEGSYFQTVDYHALSNLPETEFADWLTREVGVAAIPLSVFYSQPQERGHVRFCFAKRDATLDEALRRLQGALA